MKVCLIEGLKYVTALSSLVLVEFRVDLSFLEEFTAACVSDCFIRVSNLEDKYMGEKTANLQPTGIALKWPKYATKTLIRYREDKVRHFCSIHVLYFDS